MFALHAGPEPARNFRAYAARAALAAILAALGGCASNENTANYSGANVRVAQAATEIESDGLPAQTPPPRTIRDAPDDPSEPYSPNYGGINPSATMLPLQEEVPVNRPAPKLPSDLPPDFRKKLVAALDVAD